MSKTVRVKCPTCGTNVRCANPPMAAFFPFCSQRCRWLDLGRWFDQEYRLAETKGPLEGPDGQKDRPNSDKPEGK